MNLADTKNDNSNQKYLYSSGLKYLQTELKKKYNLNNIDQILYALAADINCIK